MYCYKCPKCGEVFWHELTDDEISRNEKVFTKCEKCGETAKRDFSKAGIHGGTSMRINAGYPFYSDAAGVNPEDVPAIKKSMAQSGIFCDFDSSGRPKFESASHRRRCLGFFGLTDKSSFY